MKTTKRRTGFFTAWAVVLTASLIIGLFTGCRNAAGGNKSKDTKIAVKSVSLSSTSLSLVKGAADKLTAKVTPSNASNKKVSWSSDKPNIAAVDQSGTVTAKEIGTATITVTTEDGGKTAKCTVTVTKPVAVTGITLDKTVLSLAKGTTGKLTAKVAPENATNKKVSWSSDKPNIAAVDQNGTVTAAAEGSAVITVKTEDGGKTAACTVTVTAPLIPAIPVTGVTLDKNELPLAKNGTYKLTATVSPENATNKNVSWNSDNPSVATVDQNGNVYTAALGSAVITVTTEEGNFTAACTVRVEEQVILKVSPSQKTIKVTVTTSNTSQVNVEGAGDTKTINSGTETSLTATGNEIILKSGQIKTIDCKGNLLTGLEVIGLSQLEGLNCSNNNLTSLDVQNLNNLKTLNCSGNQLTSLNLQNLPQLKSLECFINQLESLDVQNLAELRILNCSGNRLTSLVLQNLPQLMSIDCSLNSLNGDALTSILTGLPNRIEGENPECILYKNHLLDENNYKFISPVPNGLRAAFKDAKDIKKWAIKKIDPDKQDITLPETKTILTIGSNKQLRLLVLLPDGSKPLTVEGCNETELASNWGSYSPTTLTVKSGVSKVVLIGDIIKLSCKENALTGLDVKELYTLQELHCYKNQLTSLDVSALSQLQTLDCSENQLTNLEVQNLTQLQNLNCRSNQLTSLDVQNLTQLKNLNCRSNQLTSLAMQSNPQLKELTCYYNKIGQEAFTSILNALPERQEGENARCFLFVDQSDEQNYKFTAPIPPDLKTVFTDAIGKKWAIKKYVLKGSSFQEEDITLPQPRAILYIYGSTEIKITAVTKNGTPIAVEGCTQTELASGVPTTLNAKESIETVTLTGDIIELDLDADMSSFDIKELSELQELRFSKTGLGELDLQNFPQLRTLICNNNVQLTSLNLQNLPQLTTLDCNENQLTSLNLQNLPQLEILDCYFNQLDAADFTSLLNALPARQQNDQGYCTLYTDYGDDNYQFTDPVPDDLRTAFLNARDTKHWNIRYYNYVEYREDNIILP